MCAAGDGTPGKRVKLGKALVGAVIIACLPAALAAQGLPPPPPPPPPGTPAQVLPPIAVPAPPPTSPFGAIAPPRLSFDPSPSANPFWPIFPPPAGAPALETPPLFFDYWAIGKHSLSHIPSQITMSELSIGYDFRYPIGPFTLGARPQFEVMFLAGPTFPGPNLPPQTYGLSVALEAEYRISPQFSVRAMVAPGVYTDFDNVGGSAWRFPAELVGAYAVGPRLVLVGGAMYTAQPSLAVLPIAGAIWTPVDQWRLELTFPRLRVIRRFEDGLNVYGTFGIQGETYAIRQFGVNDLMQYRDIRLGFGAEWCTPIGLHLFIETGFAVGRRLEFDNQPSSNINSGLYLRVGGQF